MTVEQLAGRLSLEPVALCDGGAEITGGYTGDLLSYVMGRLSAGDAWVTIMVNANVVAVASLGDAACVIVADNSEIPEEVVSLARSKGVNMLRGAATAFELCAQIAALL